MSNQQKAQLKFWTRPPELLRQDLHSSSSGLSQEEDDQRLVKYGLNLFNARQDRTPLKLLSNQFKSLIEFSLIFTPLISVFLQNGVYHLRWYSIQQKSFLQGDDSINGYRRPYCLASARFTIGKFTGGKTAWLTNLRYDCRYYHFIGCFSGINKRWFYQ